MTGRDKPDGSVDTWNWYKQGIQATHGRYLVVQLLWVGQHYSWVSVETGDCYGGYHAYQGGGSLPPPFRPL